MRIAICDDDENFLNSMVKLLEQTIKELDTSIICYNTGEKLLEDYREQKMRYDVIFMDIVLEGMDGIALGKQLKELDEDMLLILLTNYAEYAVKGYEAKAFRYLLKPVNENMLKNLLTEIWQERSRKQVLHISMAEEELLVPLSKILFLEAKEKYTTVFVEEQSCLSRKSLNYYEQQLKDKGFCRVHRKYLVNLCNVSRWSAHQIEVGGYLLPVSRRKEKAFKEQFYGYLEKGIQQ